MFLEKLAEKKKETLQLQMQLVEKIISMEEDLVDIKERKNFWEIQHDKKENQLEALKKALELFPIYKTGFKILGLNKIDCTYMYFSHWIIHVHDSKDISSKEIRITRQYDEEWTKLIKELNTCETFEDIKKLSIPEYWD